MSVHSSFDPLANVFLINTVAGRRLIVKNSIVSVSDGGTEGCVYHVYICNWKVDPLIIYDLDRRLDYISKCY